MMLAEEDQLGWLRYDLLLACRAKEMTYYVVRQSIRGTCLPATLAFSIYFHVFHKTQTNF